MAVTRRGILLGAGAAGGLLVAWALTPRRFAPPRWRRAKVNTRLTHG